MLSFGRIFFVCILLASVSGCSNFRHLKSDLQVIDESIDEYIVNVALSENMVKQQLSTLVLVSLSDASENGIEVYRLLSKAGKVKFSGTAELSAFFVFNDSNQDLVYQSHEAFDLVAIDRTEKSSEAIVVNLTLRESSVQPAPEYLLGKDFASFKDMRGITINMGTVTSLDDPHFSLQQGNKGMWQPLQFMLDGGAGVHQLQPYEKHKTPVLFVHGLSGAPTNFTDMIAALDKSKYQPWVYSYPSGYKVDVISNGLFYLLNTLQNELHYKDLHIVSHSLGGLVSRKYMQQCQQENECGYLRSYTSLSAPWGGSSGAKLGADTAPVVMPVWQNLSPDSELLAQLFAEPLPNNLPHLLMFSFLNESRLGGGNSDGVVALSSQLRRDAQQQAHALRGYNQTHAGILKSKDVIADWLSFMADQQ